MRYFKVGDKVRVKTREQAKMVMTEEQFNDFTSISQSRMGCIGVITKISEEKYPIEVNGHSYSQIEIMHATIDISLIYKEF